jgi:hypothetical protein
MPIRNCICSSLNTFTMTMQSLALRLGGLDFTAFVSLKGGPEAMFLWDATLGGSYDGFTFNVWPNGGFEFDLIVGHANVFKYTSSVFPWDDGNWHTWVVRSSTVDNTITFYMDGKPLIVTPVAFGQIHWVNGSGGNMFEPYYDCYVDDIGFVARAMSSAEILQRFGPGGIGLDTSLLTAQGYYIDFNQSDLTINLMAQFSAGSVLGWPGGNNVTVQRTGEVLTWQMSMGPTMAAFYGADVQPGDVLVCGTGSATVGRFMGWVPDTIIGNLFADDYHTGTPVLMTNVPLDMTEFQLMGEEKWWVANDGTPLPPLPVKIVKNLAMLFSRWDW